MRGIIKKILKALYPIVPISSLRVILLRTCGYTVGKKVYLPSSLKISDLKNRTGNVKIGDRVSFGPNVTIITDSSPNNSKLIKIFPLVSKEVTISDDVWIGANVIILPGVNIGKCAVIGAGSVVLKDIPEYSIAYGNPAIIKKHINKDEL